MERRLLCFALGVLLMTPVLAWAESSNTTSFREKQKTEREQHWAQQKQENEAFRKSLEGKTPQEKKAAIEQHRTTQFQENKTFSQQQHQENMDFLRQRLANNNKLTAAEKDELINYFENQYSENVSFREKQHSENVSFFEQTANNSNMTQEQKKEAIKAHFAQQKEENKSNHEEQKAERKTELEKIRSEVKAQNQNSNLTTTGTK